MEAVSRDLVIPLFDGKDIMISGEFPVTIRDWDQLIRVLSAMKPALTVLSDADMGLAHGS